MAFTKVTFDEMQKDVEVMCAGRHSFSGVVEYTLKDEVKRAGQSNIKIGKSVYHGELGNTHLTVVWDNQSEAWRTSEGQAIYLNQHTIPACIHAALRVYNERRSKDTPPPRTPQKYMTVRVGNKFAVALRLQKRLCELKQEMADIEFVLSELRSGGDE